jgi:hypothetical protein
MVTLIDDRLPWWRGTADLEQIFGIRLDLDALARVPIQMVIGDEDKETWEITLSPDSRYWMEGGNDAGRTRIDRLCALHDNFAEHGLTARFDRVPGVSHNGYAILDPVHAFFAETLARQRMAGKA